MQYHNITYQITIKFRFVKISNESDRLQGNQTSLNFTFEKETCKSMLEFDVENGNTLVSQVSRFKILFKFHE